MSYTMPLPWQRMFRIIWENAVCMQVSTLCMRLADWTALGQIEGGEVQASAPIFFLFIKTTALIFSGQSQAISCSKSVLKGIRVIIFYTLDYCMPALSFQPHEHRNDLIEEVAAGYCVQGRLHVTCMTESHTIRLGVNKTCSSHCHGIGSLECLHHCPVGS